MSEDTETLLQDIRQNPSAAGLARLRAAFTATPPDSPRALNAYFSAALRVQDWAQASHAMDLLTRHFPTTPMRPFWQVELDLARGDPDAALKGFAGLGAELKQNPNVVLKWVETCLRAGDDTALARAAEHIAALPDGIPKHLAAAAAAGFAGDHDTALQHYARVREQDPGHVAATLRMVELFETRGQSDQARALLDEALAHTPDQAHPQTALRKKRMWLLLGTDPAAIDREDLQDLLARDPDRQTMLRLALAWAQATGDTAFQAQMIDRCATDWPEKAALEQASRALADGQARKTVDLTDTLPQDPTLHRQHYELRANALRVLRDHGALADLVAELAAPPATPDRLELAALMAHRADDATTAARLAASARQQDPTRLTCWNIEAQALTQLGQGARALRILSDVPDTLATHPVIQERRYWAARACGDYDTAAAALEQAAAQGSAAVKHMHIRFALKRGDWEPLRAAMAAWQPQTEADRAWKACAQGTVHLARRDAPAALASFDRALALNPELAPAWLGRAQAHLLRFDAPAALADITAENKLMRRLGTPERRPRNGIDGQLINEVLLDPDLAQAAQQAGEADTPAAQLMALSGAHPGNTLLAIRALTAQLDMPRPPATPAIPAKIFQFWPDDPADPDLQAAFERLHAMNPWADYHRFDQTTARDYIRAHADAPVARAFRLAREPEDRVNLLRLVVLHRDGGIWVEPDSLCRQSLEPLCPPGARLVAFQPPGAALGTDVLAAAPGHPVLAQLAHDVAQEILNGAQDSPWLRSGPGALTRAVMQHVAGHGSLPPDLHILPEHRLLRFVATRCPFAYKEAALRQMKAEQSGGG